MLHVAVVFAPTPWGGGDADAAPAVAAMHEWEQPLMSMMRGDESSSGGDQTGGEVEAAGDHKVCGGVFCSEW